MLILSMQSEGLIKYPFSKAWQGPRGQELIKKMLNGQPPIFMQYFKELDHVVVNPISLQPGEERIVASRLKEELLPFVPTQVEKENFSFSPVE